MEYRIEPVDGTGFMTIEQSGGTTGGDIDRMKVLGTVVFAGEVIVTTVAGHDVHAQPAVNGRVVIGHGPRSTEVIEAEFVVDGW